VLRVTGIEMVWMRFMDENVAAWLARLIVGEPSTQNFMETFCVLCLRLFP
jgi:hypothetical protein